MKIKVVGIQKDCSITYEGTTYKGRRICYEIEPNMPIEGHWCEASFLNDTKFGNIPISIGDVFFADTQRNQNGQRKITNLTNLKELFKEMQKDVKS